MKKTKFMTKVMAVVFALAILFAMSVPAWAVTTTTAEEVAKISPAEDVHTFTFAKNIVLFNTQESRILEPNVTFNYSVTGLAHATATTITDKDNLSAQIKDADASKVTNGVLICNTENGTYGATADLEFGTDNTNLLSTNAEGTDVANLSSGTAAVATKSMYVKITASAFPSAGVYRYRISDTTADPALTASGIARNANYQRDRFLDVYIKNDNDTLKVYGVVMFCSSDGTNTVAGDTSIVYDSTSTGADVKVEGYDTNSEIITEEDPNNQGQYINKSIADEYHTYNVTVNKQVGGSLGDKTNNFPFQIAFTNSTVTSSADFYWNHSAASATNHPVALSTTGAYTIGSAASNGNVTLKHGETITVVGLPTATSVAVTEYNNTPDKYTTTATFNSTNKINNQNLNTGSTQGFGATELTITAGTTDADRIVFTNNLAELSPTGLVFRVAPYVLMLAAGVSLIVLFAKRRREITDMI